MRRGLKIGLAVAGVVAAAVGGSVLWAVKHPFELYAITGRRALLKAGLLRVLAGGITGSVSRAVEQSLGIDTVQISPSIGTEADPLTPTARLILGKRLSNRAFLTFARALGAAQRDQTIILEYDQSDRLGWVFTQNGDRTFAIDFRVRRTF